MNNPWSININSWIFSDGNYADFLVDETRHFALEFHAYELSRSNVRERKAEQIDKCKYRINAQVTHVDEDMWVLDFGLQAYDRNWRSDESKSRDDMVRNEFIPNLRRGDFVEGVIFLSVDHYVYMEFLCAKEGVPPLIYTWRIDAVNKCCAPRLEDDDGTVRFDESKEQWISVNSTCARPELFTGENELVCSLLYEEASSDGLPLARWDGGGSGRYDGNQLDGRGKSDEDIAQSIASADLLLYLADPNLIDIGLHTIKPGAASRFLSRSQFENFLSHEKHRDLLCVCVSESCFYGGETLAYLQSFGFRSVFAVRMDPNLAYEIRRTEKLLFEPNRATRWRIVASNWEATEFDIGIGCGSSWHNNLGEKYESVFPDRYLLSREQLMMFLLQDSQHDGLLIVLPVGMDLESFSFQAVQHETNFRKVVFLEKGSFNINDYQSS